jgi:hypothetical protein
VAFDPSAFSLDSFDAASFDLGATEVVDVRVSFVSFDTNATPCDVKVSWLAFDTQAVPCDVRVSWLAFDSAANEMPAAIGPAENRCGPTCEVVTPSRRRRRTAQRPAVVHADVSIVCRIGCQAEAGLSINGAIDCGSAPQVSATASLHFGVTVSAEITPKLTATGDCYDTILEMLLAA